MKNPGFKFLAGCVLALVAFVTLAPIIPPPPVGAGAVEWGTIIGSLSTQTDLNAALIERPPPDDTAYEEATWDGVTTIAPSKNAVRDKIEAVVASIPAAPSGGVIGTACFNEVGVEVTDVAVAGIITSVAYLSPGRVEITIVEQPATNYIVTVSQSGTNLTYEVTNRTVTSFRVEHRNAVSTLNVDATEVSVAVLKLSQ